MRSTVEGTNMLITPGFLIKRKYGVGFFALFIAAKAPSSPESWNGWVQVADRGTDALLSDSVAFLRWPSYESSIRDCREHTIRCKMRRRKWFICCTDRGLRLWAPLDTWVSPQLSFDWLLLRVISKHWPNGSVGGGANFS